MKVVIIDDEYPALDEMKYLMGVHDAEVIGAFTDPLQGLEFVEREKPDAVFLDIDMPEMDGIELGTRMQDIVPGITIVFVTAHSQYALEAFRAYPLDYLLKPIDEERLAKTMQHILQHMKLQAKSGISALRIRCFGDFEVRCGDATVRFATQKSRELLAFLLCNADRTIYKDELVSALFGTPDVKRGLNHLRVTLYRLRNTLAASGIGKDELLICDDYSIVLKDEICDFMEFCRFVSKTRVIDSSNSSDAERIISLYKGELFSDIGALWAESKRQWAAMQAEELIIKTVAYYVLCGQDRDAEKLLLILIEINPFAEQGYPLLLDLYIRAGDTVNYGFSYRRYAKIMEELGVPVNAKYSEFYVKT